MNPNYFKCKTAANRLLLMQDLTAGVTDPRTFRYNTPVLFIDMPRYCKGIGADYEEFHRTVIKDGAVIYDRNTGVFLVVYEPVNSLRLYYTLSHEIGHICMGHDDSDRSTEEAEANAFANQLLMPEYSILMAAQEHGWINYQAVSEIFGVSPTAARNRLASLKRRRGIHVTAEDKEIYERQRDRIDLYYECLKTGKSYRNELFLREDHADEVVLNRMREQMMAFASEW